MPAGSEFLYTILRLVPSLARGERINVGVVVFCRQQGYLGARVEVAAGRLAALTDQLQPDEVIGHLQALQEVAEGVGSGEISKLPQTQRFGWLSSTSSTSIQPSPVHTGLTEDPAQTLAHLFETLVARA